MSLPDIQDAHALIQRGETQQAIAMLEQLADAFPRYATTYVLMAQAYERDERWDRALTAWQMASFFVPNSTVLRAGVQRAIHAATQKYRRTLRPPTPPPAPAPTAAPSDVRPASDETQHPTGEASEVETVDVEEAPPSVVRDPEPTDAAWVDLDDEAAAPAQAEQGERPDLRDVAADERTVAPEDAPPKEDASGDVPVDATDLPTAAAEPPAAAFFTGEASFATPEATSEVAPTRSDEPPVRPPAPGVQDDEPEPEAAARDHTGIEAFDAHAAAEEEPASPPATPEPAEGAPSTFDLREGLADEFEDLDRLIEELDGARIVPNTDTSAFPEPALEDDVDDVVSETLARIYATQHKYAEAARVYDMLAEQNPEQADAYREHARAMRNRQN